MTHYILDASALVRLFERAAGSERVETILQQSSQDQAQASMSAVNWGEARYTLIKLFGMEQAAEMLLTALEEGLDIVPATAERASRAALLKHTLKLGYADAFAAELASDSQNHILITADYGFKPLDQLLRIEFLSPKSPTTTNP